MPLDGAPLLSTLLPYVATAAAGFIIAKLITSKSNSNKTVTPQNKSSNSKNPTGIDEFVFLDQSEDGAEGDDVTDDVYNEDECEHVPYKPEQYQPAEMVTRAKQFYDEVNKRRTCRFFSSKPVPIQAVNYILKAAGTSPSGAHTEPWTYVVVSNSDIKRQIRKIVEEEEEVNYNKRMGSQWVSDLQKLKTNFVKPYLEEAPYIILVFKQSYGITSSGQRQVHYYNELSVAISVGILITAIQHAGLVTVTSTPMNAGPQLRALVGRPANEKLILLLPLGYAAEDATVPDLKRKPLSDIMVLLD